MSFVQSRPCSKTISVVEMPNERLKSETDFFTHECQCQAESVSGAGFRWYAAKLCVRFAKLCATRRFTKRYKLFLDRGAFEPGLLPGLRNECFGRIEKTTTPESLVRKRAGLPLLETRQSRRYQPAILGIKNQHHSKRAGWSSRELSVFLLEQGFCEFQFCARTGVRCAHVGSLHGQDLDGLSSQRLPGPREGCDFFVLDLKLFSAGRRRGIFYFRIGCVGVRHFEAGAANPSAGDTRDSHVNPVCIHVENLELVFRSGEKQYFGTFDRTYQNRRARLSDRNEILWVRLVAENFLQTLGFFGKFFHVLVGHRLLRS